MSWRHGSRPAGQLRCYDERRVSSDFGEAHTHNDVQAGVRRSTRAVSHQRGESVDRGKPGAANAMPPQRSTLPAQRPMCPRRANNKNIRINPDAYRANQVRNNPDSILVGALCMAPTYKTRAYKVLGAALERPRQALWNTSLAAARAQNSAYCANRQQRLPRTAGR